MQPIEKAQKLDFHLYKRVNKHTDTKENTQKRNQIRGSKYVQIIYIITNSIK